MTAVTQFQVKVNGGLLFSSTNKRIAESRFNKAKQNHPNKYVSFEQVVELKKYNPLILSKY